LASISLEGNPTDGEYQELTYEQIQLLQFAYNLGKDHDLGYSMAAIAWQESFVGDQIVPINLQDPSAGLWHKNIRMAFKETFHEKPLNGLLLNIMARKLIDDVEFAASFAIADLEHWKEVRDGEWMAVWASYNAGNRYLSPTGQEYARGIKKKIQTLRRYLPFQ